MKTKSNSEAASSRQPKYYTIDAAAELLDTTPVALRARCRRNLSKKNGRLTASLGGGVTAIKFGASWRIRFSNE